VTRLGKDVEIRGKGLIWGLDFGRDASPVLDAARERGLIVNRTAETVIRLLPPYVMTEDEIERGLSLLERAIVDAFGGTDAR
jgi:acetylornithine/succinyldiaminopimelate/putrescine aminotransferase